MPALRFPGQVRRPELEPGTHARPPLLPPAGVLPGKGIVLPSCGGATRLGLSGTADVLSGRGSAPNPGAARGCCRRDHGTTHPWPGQRLRRSRFRYASGQSGRRRSGARGIPVAPDLLRFMRSFPQRNPCHDRPSCVGRASEPARKGPPDPNLRGPPRRQDCLQQRGHLEHPALPDPLARQGHGAGPEAVVQGYPAGQRTTPPPLSRRLQWHPSVRRPASRRCSRRLSVPRARTGRRC